MAQINSGYSSSQMLAMQKDAADRVREMQRRAQEKLKQSNQYAPVYPPLEQRESPRNSTKNEPLHHPPTEKASSRACTEPQIAASSSPANSIFKITNDLLDQFHLDEDRILLLLLLFVLAREKADPLLLLALVYLLL